MTPDSVESRLARVEQRQSDLQIQVDRLIPLHESQAELRTNMHHLQHLAQQTHKDLLLFEDKIDKRDEERDRQVSLERRGTRNALYALTGTLGAAVIAVAGVIAAALIGG